MTARDYPELETDARRSEPHADFEAYDAMLRAAGMPARLIGDFSERYARYRAGDDGKLAWSDITPPAAADLVELSALPQLSEERKRELLGQIVCIKLNGGLGTTMKLSSTKSLIPVREGRSFLRIIADHVLGLRAAHGVEIPLLLMNSYRTRVDSLAALAGFPQQGMDLDFLQHKVPRIDVATQLPTQLEPEDERWSPPGHGDVYLALYVQGLLDRLLARGIRWAFVSNVDNLGATIEPRIPGFLDDADLDFVMEVTPKTAADRKGGPLVRWQGKLMLLERTQVPDAHFADFEDIDRFSTFNTNSLWWRIEAMRDLLRTRNLEMPMIVNPKQLQGRDVAQLEIAMGAAIGNFKQARGVVVSRQRFAPVKATCDLLGVRSDAYVLDDLGGLRPHPARDAALGPPVIELDDRYYKGVDELDLRIPEPPSLRRCRRLRVHGDVRFGRGVVCEGDVELRAPEGEVRQLVDGTKLADCTLDL